MSVPSVSSSSSIISTSTISTAKSSQLSGPKTSSKESISTDDRVKAKLPASILKAIDQSLLGHLITKLSTSNEDKLKVTTRRSWTSGSKTVTVVSGKDTFVYKVKTKDGITCEGEFKYNKLLNKKVLVNGKMTFPSGKVYEGQFACFGKTKPEMVLTQGKVTFSNGTVHVGEFGFSSHSNIPVLKHGDMTFPDGRSYTDATFKYSKDSRNMEIVHGKISLPNGNTEEGRFSYNQYLRKTVLEYGTKTFQNGDVHHGSFEYDSDRHRMVLTWGSKTLKEEGVKEEGTFKYNNTMKEMVLMRGTKTFSDGTVYKDATFGYFKKTGYIPVPKWNPGTKSVPVGVV